MPFKNPQEETTIIVVVPVIRLNVKEAKKRQDLNPAPSIPASSPELLRLPFC